MSFQESAGVEGAIIINDKRKFKTHDKVKVLELLGKYLSLFTETKKIEFPDEHGNPPQPIGALFGDIE